MVLAPMSLRHLEALGLTTNQPVTVLASGHLEGISRRDDLSGRPNVARNREARSCTNNESQHRCLQSPIRGMTLKISRERLSRQDTTASLRVNAVNLQ